MTEEAMTIEEALVKLSVRSDDLILVHDHGNWYVQDIGTLNADVLGRGDSWPEAVSVALGRPIVERDPAQELRDAVIQFTKASDAHYAPPGYKPPGATGNYLRASIALLRLGRRLVGMEDS